MSFVEKMVKAMLKEMFKPAPKRRRSTTTPFIDRPYKGQGKRARW